MNPDWPAHPAGNTGDMVRRDRYGEPIEPTDLELRHWESREAHSRYLARSALQTARAALPDRTPEPEHTRRREGLKTRLSASQRTRKR